MLVRGRTGLLAPLEPLHRSSDIITYVVVTYFYESRDLSDFPHLSAAAEECIYRPVDRAGVAGVRMGGRMDCM